MANFTAKDVQKLRELTGVGMMDCKKALTEADGDFDKAVIILREKGLSAAAKKADRIAAEGVVATVLDGNTAAVVEVNAETDFVAQNKEFLDFADAIARTVIKNKPASLEALNALKVDGHETTVEEEVREKILVIGEKISIRRFDIVENLVSEYLHANKRIGVLVQFKSDADLQNNDAFKTASKDVAMQIAAIAPKYIRRDEVPADEVEAEKKFLTEQVVNEGKPEHIAEKIVAGRINKFFEQICLEEQAFVKDGSISVGEYVKQAGKEAGADFAIDRIVRYEVGEGMEKREENFADEVASMMK